MLMSSRGRWLAAVAAFVCVAAPAHAEKRPKWELGLGAAAVTIPDYRGSDEVQNYVLPFPLLVYRLDWIKADRHGVRSRLFESETTQLNISLSAAPPVRSKDNAAREGMDDLKPLLEFGPSLDFHLWRSANERIKLDFRNPVRWAFTAELEPRAVGVNYSPRLNLDIDGIAGRPWQLGILVGPVFGSRRHHDYIYGVPQEHARAGRPAYAGKGGYAGTQFLAALSRRYGDMWVGGYLRYDTLHGAAFEDSPLVKRKNYASAGIAMTWTIGKSSTLVEVDDE